MIEIRPQALPALIVFIPFLGSFLVPFVGRVSKTARNWFSLALIVVPLVLAFSLIRVVISGDVPTFELAGTPILFADNLAVFMSLVSLGIGAVIVFYSFGYIDHYENQNEYYFMVVMFLAAMMGLVFSRNLIALFVFWEITAIACWRLIGFFRSALDVIRADKAFLVTVFGALMMLIGFFIIAGDAGSFDLVKIREASAVSQVSNVAIVFILIGILSKSSTLPFHTWLPDAGVAPSPVTALLHAAVLVKIGVYVFARLFLATFVTIDPVWHTIIPIIAAASALVSAGAALIDTDLKRIIAYSTVSQIGFIFLGLAVGGKMAITGALLFILMHGIAKGGLFLCAGIVEQNTGTKNIREMGGLAAKMPITALSFALCAFSVIGIPPLGGFFSKYLVISGAFGSGHTVIAAVFTAGAVLTVLYLLRTFMMVFLGESRLTNIASVREGSFTMVSSVALLAAGIVVISILFAAPSFFANAAVNQMLGN